MKFLRKPTTEYLNIKEIVIQEALSNPDVSIILSLDGKVSIKTSGNGLENCIVEIFGRNVLKNIKKFPLGYLGNGALDSIFTFINGRMVKSKIVENAVMDGYYTKLMKGKYPFAIIFLEVDPKSIDVNVHPSKKIVKFDDEERVYYQVLNEIKKSFERDDDFISPTFEEKIEKEESKFLDFSEFEKFTPIKAEPQKFENLTVIEKPQIEEKKVEDEIIKEEKLIEDEIEESNYKVVVQEEELDFSIKEEKKEVPQEKKRVNFRVIGQVFETFILVRWNF